MAAVGKAQSIEGGSCRCNALGTLQRGNQGVDFATDLKAPQSADGALAGLPILVAKGLHQLCVASITCLGDLDEHGAQCNATWERIKLRTEQNVPLQEIFSFDLKNAASP